MMSRAALRCGATALLFLVSPAVAWPPPPPPPVVVERPPPPLSPAMRIIYAPFYVAGLVLRDGVYYVLVAPFEVFARALSFGVEGGVDDNDRR